MILASLLLSFAIAGEVPVSTPNVTAAFGAQAQPQIASDGTNFLVAWRDNRHSDNYGSIWASRVDPEGRMLDLPTGIPIFSSTNPSPGASTNAAPAVVWTGGSWLVLWTGSDLSRLEIRRVDRDGSLPDSAPRNIDAGTIVPGAIGAAGGRVLVAYALRFGGIGARLLDENGAPVGNPIPLQRASGEMNPVVASNGRSFLEADPAVHRHRADGIRQRIPDGHPGVGTDFGAHQWHRARPRRYACRHDRHHEQRNGRRNGGAGDERNRRSGGVAGE